MEIILQCLFHHFQCRVIFFLKYFLFYFMCLSIFLQVYMYIRCVFFCLWKLEEAPGPLKLELHMVFSNHVGTRNQTRLLWRALHDLSCWAIPPAQQNNHLLNYNYQGRQEALCPSQLSSLTSVHTPLWDVQTISVRKRGESSSLLANREGPQLPAGAPEPLVISGTECVSGLFCPLSCHHQHWQN